MLPSLRKLRLNSGGYVSGGFYSGRYFGRSTDGDVYHFACNCFGPRFFRGAGRADALAKAREHWQTCNAHPTPRS